jgi:uncharacterized beta-barrel protein YwiB (DUF1934 family)
LIFKELAFLDNNAIFSIVAEQSVPNGDTNRMEMMTEGRFYKEDGCSCLEYEESDMVGLGGSTTLMMVTGGLVSLIRRGRTTTHMVFSEGKKSYNVCKIPGGSMEMGIWPTGMQVEIGEEKGEITLEYELDIGGQFTGSNMISVSYRLKQS